MGRVAVGRSAGPGGDPRDPRRYGAPAVAMGPPHGHALAAIRAEVRRHEEAKRCLNALRRIGDAVPDQIGRASCRERV